VGWPLGVVYTVFGQRPDFEAAARDAQRLGFDHIDVRYPYDGELALPIYDRIAFPDPQPGCSSPAPFDAEGAWDAAVAAFRGVPTARIEPWLGSILPSIEATREFLDAVPAVTLLVDTGHVANWGEDPVELLPWATHVQFRQASKGVPQALSGDVDFPRVVRRLRELDYRGRISIEYLDVPEIGMTLDDPIAFAVELAAEVRPLLR
jgi:sugar phosphate isomerase/epimerase